MSACVVEDSCHSNISAFVFLASRRYAHQARQAPSDTPGTPRTPGTPGTPCATSTPGSPGDPPVLEIDQIT